MNNPLTRIELLRLVIGRARSNGFRFRHWYTTQLGEPWIDSETSLQLLEHHLRFYSLIFSQEFARSFWKPGSEIIFQVAAQTFQRRMPDGTVGTVSRKPFTRRNARPDAWRFHLREMALAEDPLRYLRKYLLIQETGAEASAGCNAGSAPKPEGIPVFNAEERLQHTFARPLTRGSPHFCLAPIRAGIQK